MSTDDVSAEPQETETASNSCRFVVAVGASAGGLEALENLFREMPENLDAAFLVQQHLSPDFQSRMVELLARHTALEVEVADAGKALIRGHIYVAPPARKMIVSDGRILLTERDHAHPFGLPIDGLFRSVARDAGDRAVGIVLSGSGTDGSRGAKDIAEAGGIVLAQEPSTAGFDGMPTSVIATGIVERISPPEEIGGVLAHLMAHRTDGSAAPDVVAEPEPESESPPPTEMEVILKLLRRGYGIDFALYKPKTVMRRIARRLEMGSPVSLSDYVSHLQTHPEELSALYGDLLIGVTKFFRDPDAFDALRKLAIEPLLDRKPAELRVWVAGCATGEEAYSVGILIDEAIERRGLDIPYKVFATDVDRASLQTASIGRYDTDALSEVDEERKSRYFRSDGDGFRVAKRLRNRVVFASHNVIADAPFTRLDLICCRNLLIYLQPPVQKKVIALFHFGLQVDGALFLGPSETPGDLSDELEPLSLKWRIYRKRRDIRIPTEARIGLGGKTPEAGGGPGRMRGFSPARSDSRLLGIYDQLLARRMSPSVLVDEDHDVLHTFAGGEKYLQIRPGRPAHGVLELITDELRTPLAGALQRSERESKTVTYTALPVTFGGKVEHVEIRVVPIDSGQTRTTDYLIELQTVDRGEEDPESPEPEQLDVVAMSREHIGSLETELRYTKENLQATIEELETSNEELQATNEELVASNEELQSTNEELQSVNEELHSVNAELHEKIEQLTEVTSDMDNLLHVLDIGVLFLDVELRIRKFNAAIAEVFHLMPRDRRRRFDHFAHTIRDVALKSDIERVIATSEPVEREVVLGSGQRHLLRVRPHVTDDGVEGALLILLDIEKLRRMEDRSAHLSAIVENSHDAIIGETLDGHITSWNHGAERLYGYAAEEALGESVGLIIPEDRQSEVEEIREALSEESAFERETVRLTKTGERVDVAVSVSPLRDGGGTVIGGSVIARDIRKQKHAARQLERAIEQRDEFIAMLSHELRNPLMGMLTAAEVFENQEPAAEVASRASKVVARQARHMARLLDDLLDISRLQHGEMKLRMEPMDLRSIVQLSLDEVRSRAERGGQKLEVRLPNEPVSILGDSSRLVQLLTNLLTNALSHTPDGRRIEISMRSDDRGAWLAVADEGAGMPEHALERVFDPFVRLGDDPNAKAQTYPGQKDGLGLGLAVVRAIASAHKGTVTASSAGIGHGARVEVRLPMAPSTEPEPPPAPTPALPVGGARSLLLVEDHRDNRELLEMMLESRGFEVKSAEDAESAVSTFEAGPTAIAVVDIGLPDAPGTTVARRIRAMAGPTPLLIALTGHGRQQDREEILSSGFDRHLVKPVSVDDLERAILEEQARAREPS